MKNVAIVVCALLMGSTCAFALEKPPASAKAASVDELKSLIDGKKLDVVIFDDEAPVTANLVWSWKKKSISGTAFVNNKDKVNVDGKLSFAGDKACFGGGKKSKPKCNSIFIDGNKFYEIRDDGNVHAISTVK